MFEKLLREEPEVLLRGDIGSTSDRNKGLLVDAILRVRERNSHAYDWGVLRRRYRKLLFPALPEQLRDKLRTRALSDEVIHETIRFAEACELRELYQDILAIALDISVDIWVRDAAAEVVGRSGDPGLLRQLVPMALGQAGVDPKHELRGHALKACWPNFITASQLFETLVPPRHQNAHEYPLLFSGHLSAGLSVADLPVALDWVAALPQQRSYPGDEFLQLAIQILTKALSSLDDEDLLKRFAKTLLARMRTHDLTSGVATERLMRPITENQPLRYRIVLAMLPFIEDSKVDTIRIAGWGGLRLLSSEDLPWVLQQIELAPEAHQQPLSYMALRLFFPVKVTEIDAVATLASSNVIFRKIMQIWVEPVDVRSPAAEKARAMHADEKESERLRLEQEGTELNPSPMERVKSFLQRAEEGHPEDFWHATVWLGINEHGHYVSEAHHLDIRKVDVWERVDDELRARLIFAADGYLRLNKVPREEWIDKEKIIHYPTFAGARAIHLLQEEAGDHFDRLPAEVWREWFPAILRHQDRGSKEMVTPIIETAAELLGEEANALILDEIKFEIRTGPYLSLLGKLPEAVSPKLEADLLRLLQSGIQVFESFQRLLTFLVQRNAIGALDFTRSEINRNALTDELGRKKCLWAAYLLLHHGVEKDWAPIWELIQHDETVGQYLCEVIQSEHFSDLRSYIRILGVYELASFWEWVLTRYPIEADPDRNQGGAIDRRWGLANLRDSLLSQLADRASTASCQELRRLGALHPSHEYIARALNRAEEELRRSSWQPILADRIFALCQNSKYRLVESPAQLLDVVMAALKQVQLKLKAETPAAPFLWNGNRPKDEEAFSDWLKIELEAILVNKGVILGREMQIHRKERTDLHIDAVAKDPRGMERRRISVIVEVKGCWHPKMSTAMESQLLLRYLKDNDCCRGIYLVGWYQCPSWDADDYRKDACGFQTIEELREFLITQAALLSNKEVVIRATVLDVTVDGTAG